ncbi:MAG: glycosyltransferase, partial [Magnetospirillum sp.]|nr:glycosyltransferase [Magnetospirillum sp.]
MRILVVSDAWFPQINGVVRTLDTLRTELEKAGHHVVLVTPDRFRSIPCPTYPEIRLALKPGRRMAQMIAAAQPCAIHIATEGPLGWAARSYCLKHAVPFTTAYHTKFPEYIQARFRVPVALSYAVMRRFHSKSSKVMVATQGIEDELIRHGFGHIGRWSRGVDT